MSAGDTKLSVLVSLFSRTQKSKKSAAQKRSKFRKFLDTFCKPSNYFSRAIRLIFPSLDRERGAYGLKESVRPRHLPFRDALGMSRDPSEDARRLFNWPQGPVPMLAILLLVAAEDIEVGKAVRAQLALRIGDAAAAWKKA